MKYWFFFVLVAIPIIGGVLLIAGMLAWFDKLFGAAVSVLLTVLICVVLFAIVIALSKTISERNRKAKLREMISEYVNKVLETIDNTSKN